MKIQYLFKRGSTYNFRQRVPLDLKHFFRQLSITTSFHTKDYSKAVASYPDMAARYEALWAHLRDPAACADAGADRIMTELGAVPGDCAHGGPDFNYGIAAKWVEHLIGSPGFANGGTKIAPADKVVARRLFSPPVKDPTHLLSQALDIYLKYHTRGTEPEFCKDRRRPIQYVIDAVGDLPLPDYTRAHARQFSESLTARGLKTKSVRDYIGLVTATFNRAKVEWELSCGNPFSKLNIINEHADDEKVPDFTAAELETIVAACLIAKDPDVAHSVAIQLETGCRISEILGLRADDVQLSCAVPHILIRGNSARPLKTTGSERAIPVVGIALSAATEALAQSGGHSGWLFPCVTSRVSPGAKIAVNRWLAKVTGTSKGSHSFRHSLETRLTLAEVPQGIIDQITGHVNSAKSRVAAGYFSGFPLARLQDALLKIALPAQDHYIGGVLRG
jgi:integrase